MTALDQRVIAPTAMSFPRRRPNPLSSDTAAAWFATAPRALPARQIYVLLTEDGEDERRPDWLKSTEARLNGLLVLEPGWDGLRALPMTDDAVRSLLRVLAWVMSDDMAVPQVFPLIDGGLQGEWHAMGHDIEIEVEGDGSVYAIASTPDGEVCVDEDILWTGGAWDPPARDSLVAVTKALAVLTQVVNDAAYA